MMLDQCQQYATRQAFRKSARLAAWVHPPHLVVSLIGVTAQHHVTVLAVTVTPILVADTVTPHAPGLRRSFLR